MNLNEYPTAIAKLQAQLTNFDLAVEQTQAMLKQIESEIDTRVAFDATLKNDAQRKAKRSELLDEHPNYWEQQEILGQTKAKREAVFIELCLRRNEFSVLKLEKREAIARLELQANS
jgi:anti-sigma-K factor RskA